MFSHVCVDFMLNNYKIENVGNFKVRTRMHFWS